jgi:hypothetical protein
MARLRGKGAGGAGRAPPRLTARRRRRCALDLWRGAGGRQRWPSAVCLACFPTRLPSGPLTHLPLLSLSAPSTPPARRLKDVIFGFGSSSVYVVLECLDCDLRDLLDRDDAAVDIRQVKVRAPSVAACGGGGFVLQLCWQRCSSLHHSPRPLLTAPSPFPPSNPPPVLHVPDPLRRPPRPHALRDAPRPQAAEHPRRPRVGARQGRRLRPRALLPAAPQGLHRQGRHPLVPRARAAAGVAHLQPRDRHVVGRLHLRRARQPRAAVPRRERDRAAAPRL